MPALAYHPNFGEEISYEFEPLPEDPDSQVAATIERLKRNVHADCEHPLIAAQAERALKLGQGNGLSYAQQAMLGTWRLVKPNIKFRHDEDLANDLRVSDRRKSDVVEVVIRPVDQAQLIERGRGVEDCDGFEGYASCILHHLGVPCSFVTVSAEPEEPRRFTHVYLACYADGERTALDFSHGPYPGWECPNAGRLKEWPVVDTFGARLWDALMPVVIVTGLWYALRYATRGGQL